MVFQPRPSLSEQELLFLPSWTPCCLFSQVASLREQTASNLHKRNSLAPDKEAEERTWPTAEQTELNWTKSHSLLGQQAKPTGEEQQQSDQ